MAEESPAAQPSKAVVPTVQNSTTALDKIRVLGVVTLPKEDIEKLLKTQAAPQSTTINIQINNNITINNYNGPPPEAQKTGHQAESRDRPNQGPRTTAPASRAVEAKPRSVDNVTSAPSSTQATQQKSQTGSGDRTQGHQPSKVQTHPAQDIAPLETTTVSHERPSIGQAHTKAAQNGSKKPASAIGPVGHVSGPGGREASQPKSSETKRWLERFLHSGPKDKASPPATTSPARRSIGNHSSGSREVSAVKKLQKEAQTSAACHHGQTSHGSRGHTASGQPVARYQHSGSQPAKREEPAGVAHGSSAANTSSNQRTGAVAEGPKVLKKKDIENREQIP